MGKAEPKASALVFCTPPLTTPVFLQGLVSSDGSLSSAWPHSPPWLVPLHPRHKIPPCGVSLRLTANMYDCLGHLGFLFSLLGELPSSIPCGPGGFGQSQPSLAPHLHDPGPVLRPQRIDSLIWGLENDNSEDTDSRKSKECSGRKKRSSTYKDKRHKAVKVAGEDCDPLCPTSENDFRAGVW